MEKMDHGRTQTRAFAMLLLEIGMEIMYFLWKKKSYCYAILGKCMQNDIHFAWEEKAFPMLLLEKDGSSQNNIQEC